MVCCEVVLVLLQLRGLHLLRCSGLELLLGAHGRLWGPNLLVLWMLWMLLVLLLLRLWYTIL